MRYLRICLGLFLFLGVLFVLFYFLINARTFQLGGKLLSHVETTEKVVALTFDDGPSERTTDILRILDEQDVHATFYLVGKEIEQHPEFATDIVKADHELGNHSCSHQRMVLKSKEFIASELERTDQAIRNAGYTGNITFRPPYGKKFIGLPRYLKQADKTTVMWNVDPGSHRRITNDADAITSFVLKETIPGSIILLHAMYHEPDLEALPEIISGLRAQGYRFVTVSELQHIPPDASTENVSFK